MASIKVIIYDPTGSKKTPVELPADVPMQRLIPALVSKMGLPTSQGANPITYRLDHRDSGKRLSDSMSLADAGVKQDDILSLFPEVTAG
ncbi:MAG: EsaB/YukD family protein [Anaerolineales bacterium]|nr:EsaB/YukD family protein [Anaerolineales bacterium]MCB8961119.1 EsaB/YukD family protein [Ardenticatenales bacterium]MCB0005141.1 EsaB/YukD family protein [Anaerolineales bacterium]MCB0011030.1 EsaB/YukD family protein [Anaerolineales bacterium]MCB0016893.1 EsaB/YukD family protein [Anaerolineales bacterium]